MQQFYYWVVYVTDSGTGGIELYLNKPITKVKQINNLSEYIKKNISGGKDVVITNFIFLRKETEDETQS